MVQKNEYEDELDPRAREVLREIVRQYIETAEPISSRSLAQSGRFGLSPASIRNVMADLENLGFVFQPHTSAGRIPTDRGYRYFINYLMKSRRLSSHERETIDEQVGQVGELDEVMQLASRLLSKMTNQVGIVFMPTLKHVLMRSIGFIAVADHRLMCVIVGTNGVVVNKLIETLDSFERDELDRIGRYLSDEFSGMSLEAIRDSLTAKLREEAAMRDEAFRRTIGLGIDAVEDVMPAEHELYVEGAISMLQRREFSDADTIWKNVLAFEQKEKLVEILNRCLGSDGLQILIGDETPFTQSYNFALVATRYGTGPAGLVGVMGPTRMEYQRMAPLVDYLARALSRKIEESGQEHN